MNETDLVAAAERLDTSMNELAGEVKRLRQYGVHNRHMIWGLIVSIVLSLVMGGVAINASQQAKQATSQAARNAENAKITCEAGNESRSLGRQLWTYVLDLSSENPTLTAQQKKQIALFRGYVATVYAPRDCNAASPTPLIPTPTR
jgi:hypothetical protein